jgi:hypothetical protein
MLTKRTESEKAAGAPVEAGGASKDSRPAEASAAGAKPAGGVVSDFLWGTKRKQGMVETMAKQAARTVGGQLGRQILRGMLGGILGGSRR